jgi:hypothetical protein
MGLAAANVYDLMYFSDCHRMLGNAAIVRIDEVRAPFAAKY